MSNKLNWDKPSRRDMTVLYKGDVVQRNDGIYATVSDVLGDVAMIVPWNSGHEEIHRFNTLTYVGTEVNIPQIKEKIRYGAG